MLIVFNAANELAVKKFLEEDRLLIFMRLLHSLWKDIKIAHPDLDEILSVEQDTYQ